MDWERYAESLYQLTSLYTPYRMFDLAPCIGAMSANRVGAGETSPFVCASPPQPSMVRHVTVAATRCVAERNERWAV